MVVTSSSPPRKRSLLLVKKKTMENTSSNVDLESKDALHSQLSNNNTEDSLGLKENSNCMIDATLKYLSKMLEEETHEKDTDYEGPDLWAVEKRFYNTLGQEYPPLLNTLSLSDQPEADPSCSYSPLQCQIGPSSRNELAPVINQVEGKETYVVPVLGAGNMASKANNNLFPFVLKGSVDGMKGIKINLQNEDNENPISVKNGSRGKNKSHVEDLDLIQGRNCKILMPYVEEPTRDASFDEVLLYDDFYTKEVSSLREIMRTRNESKIQEKASEVKDLLIRCSQATADNDRQTAQGLIKEIRKQSSPDGNADQRVACVLADALEARLTVTGSETYKRFVGKIISITDSLKVHRLFTTAAPFSGISYFFANQTILKAVEKTSKLHIVDFGINHGFQWPSLIQMLSNRKKGTIKLRITGIELPCPGFRPDEMVQETGRRLKEYARMFNVPFEYHGIASQWENIRVNDFRIEKDEMLIVNSMYRFRQLGDETTSLDCPRDQVLKLICCVRPDIFIYGIFNWTYSPFFVQRFKQAMLLYETIFDLLDTLIPRDNKERQIIEREMLARDATNAIACEGAIWLERPESYRSWHRRTLRAGFEQIPLDHTIVKKCEQNLRTFYDNKGFFVEEESNWFLQGWRGKILYGLSAWKPK